MIDETHFGRQHDTLKLWTIQLYKEFSGLCYSYRLQIKKPVIRIVEMASRWGTWDPQTRTISISRQLIDGYSWHAVLDVLKHEVAHMIVNESYNIPDHTHGDAFKRACRFLGISAWASASDADLAHVEPGRDPTALTEQEQRLLKRAEKLLALAGSQNEHEALLAMERVRELYARYNLERLSQTRSDTQFMTVIINHNKKMISQHQSVIAGILTGHFFVEVIYTSLYHAKTQTRHKVLEILGVRQNVIMAEYIYYFLLNQLEQLWNGYRAQAEKYTGAKRSFYLGVLQGFSDKLNATSYSKSAASSTSNPVNPGNPDEQALITLGKSELEDYVRQQFPRLSIRHSKRSISDVDSYLEGQRAGKNIVINKPIASQGTAKVHYLT